MEVKYIQKIAEKLSFSIKQITNIHDLQSEGATIPFMARYRKEATNNMDEVGITAVVKRSLIFLNWINAKKQWWKRTKAWVN